MWMLLVLIFCSNALKASASDASVTFVVRSSHETSLLLKKQLFGAQLTESLWSATISHDTIFVVRVADPEFTIHTISDPGHLVSEEFYLEPGDSLVYFLDLNSATSKSGDDKLGMSSVYESFRLLRGRYISHLDSASRFMRWTAYQKLVDFSLKDLRSEASAILAQLTKSKRLSLAQADLDYFPLQMRLHYLSVRDWDAAMIEELCGSEIPYLQDMRSNLLTSSHRYEAAMNEWFSLLDKRELALGRVNGSDSLKMALITQSSGVVRNHMLLNYVQRYLIRNSTSRDLSYIDSLVSGYPFANPLAAKAYESIIATKRQLVECSLAPEIELPDSSGILRRLSEYRGKVVLVDFWGTWCAPCLSEIPHLKMLSADYADTDLVILGVALESRAVGRWKNFIRSRKMRWSHVYAEGQFYNPTVKQFGIASVPSYMLLDREGRIVTPNAPRPSRKELRELIDATLANQR